MTDTDPRDGAGAYPPPSFDELAEMALQLGLLTGASARGALVQLRVAGIVFELPPDQAELLLHGVLLGYFVSQAGEERGPFGFD